MNCGNPYQQYSYNNYGYQNYGRPNYMQQQIPFQQQSQTQQQSPVQYETPIQDIRFATSEEAKAFIVMPNSKALLIDKNGGIAHLKTADNMGQSVTQYYKFEQVNADGTPLKPQEPTPQIDYAQFLTKKDIDGLPTAEQYKKLSDQYNSLVEQFKTMQKIMASVNAPKSNDRVASRGNTQEN